MPETFAEADDAAVRSFRRVHANGEQTRVLVVKVADRDYAAIAYDLDPSDFTPLAAECIAYDPTVEGATERAERWMQAHPKGVLGAGDDDGGSRWLDVLKRIAGKINEYGNEQIEQTQQQHEKQP